MIEHNKAAYNLTFESKLQKHSMECCKKNFETDLIWGKLWICSISSKIAQSSIYMYKTLTILKTVKYVTEYLESTKK